jgi:hypothetical protein
MATRLEQLTVSFVKRNAIQRGPTSSNAWNDTFDEISRDLLTLRQQWNNFLLPLTSVIPDGTEDASVNAFENGLDGRSIYVKSDATVSNTTYYSAGNSRPKTIYEQFADIYNYVDGINASLSGQLTGQTFSAGNISILDNAGLYIANNVEDALAEVMSVLDPIAEGLFLPLAGGNVTGNIEVTGQIFNTLPGALLPVGTTQDVDWNDGNRQTLDLGSASGDVDISLSNGLAGASYMLKIIQSSIFRSVTWPANVKWPSATPPTLSTAEDSVDIISLYYDGTDYYGDWSNDYA